MFSPTWETRLTVAMHVKQAELQSLLPAPWQVNPVAAGPLKDANLMLNFVDPFLLLDGQGKPTMGGINRLVSFGVPAKNMQTGETGVMQIGGLASNPLNVPGAYKVYTHATLRRKYTHKGADMEPGVVNDLWEIRNDGGGIIKLRIQYQRALPTRGTSEARPHSLVEPTFYRIYRSTGATDIVKSVPGGIDRVRKYQLRVTVPKLQKLLDGTEQLVGISVSPINLREVFLP